MNLVVNAREAMPVGGQLRIETRAITGMSPGGDVPAGRWVRLEVSDSGPGLSPEVQARAFGARSWRTRPLGHGASLGLATCAAVVRQAGGHMGLQAEPGGTTFRVHLESRAGRAATSRRR